MRNFEDVDNSDLKRLHLFFYLIPIIGFFPSALTLYRHRGVRGEERGTKDFLDDGEPGELQMTYARRVKREQLTVSRLSVTLALSWLLGYLLLNIGAETAEFLTLRLLILNSLLTSGYFLVSIWLMVRLGSRQSVRLPGFSRLAERAGKHLS